MADNIFDDIFCQRFKKFRLLFLKILITDLSHLSYRLYRLRRQLSDDLSLALINYLLTHLIDVLRIERSSDLQQSILGDLSFKQEHLFLVIIVVIVALLIINDHVILADALVVLINICIFVSIHVVFVCSIRLFDCPSIPVTSGACLAH